MVQDFAIRKAAGKASDMVAGATGSPAWGQAAGLATNYFANRALQPTTAQPTAAQPTTAQPGGGGSAGSAPSAPGDDAVAGDQGAGGEDGDPDPDPAASVPEPESTLGQMSLRYSPGEQPDIFA